MVGPQGMDLILFVAGEPGVPDDSMRDVNTSLVGRLGGSVISGWLSRATRPAPPPAEGAPLPSEESQPWHLPSDQIQCANLVFDIAKDAGRNVLLVDVNRPLGRQDLVNRWVGSDGVVPMLVRPGGGRLQGFNQFVPGTVRRFIRGR
jgi:hypothetical protein